MFNHILIKHIQQTARTSSIFGLQPQALSDTTEIFFSACAEGYFSRRPHRRSPTNHTEHTDTICVDFVGPIKPVSAQGHTYIMIAIHVQSRYLRQISLKAKSKSCTALIHLFTSMKRAFLCRIKPIHSENSRELNTLPMKCFLQFGITRTFPAP